MMKNQLYLHEKRQIRIHKTLRWPLWVVSGFLLLIDFGSISPSYGQTAQSTPISPTHRLISSEMVVASNSAFRAAEGELLIMTGDSLQMIAPFTWQSPAEGVIACSTEFKKIRYDLQYHQRILGEGASACKVGILDVTLTNIGNTKSEALLWISWRHRYAPPQFPLGFSLGTAGSHASQEGIVDDRPWNPMSTWYFLEDELIHDERIVYLLSRTKGWERETWVRRPETPYRDLTEESMLGYTRLRREIDTNGITAVQVLVPYRPIQKSSKNTLSPLIPPGE